MKTYTTTTPEDNRPIEEAEIWATCPHDMGHGCCRACWEAEEYEYACCPVEGGEWTIGTLEECAAALQEQEGESDEE